MEEIFIFWENVHYRVYGAIYKMYFGLIVGWQYPHNESLGRTLMGRANNAKHKTF